MFIDDFKESCQEFSLNEEKMHQRLSKLVTRIQIAFRIYLYRYYTYVTN